jgi:hypothetical protein
MLFSRCSRLRLVSIACVTLAGTAPLPEWAQPPPEEHTLQPTPAAAWAVADRTLVIAYAGQLKTVAEEWGQYRTSQRGGGWNVVLHAVAPAQDATAQRTAVQQFIRDAYRARKPSRNDDFAALLLGDADENGIPAWYFPQTDPLLKWEADGPASNTFVSDHPYQLLDDADDIPDIALGRVPARDSTEARMALHKIMHYEAAAIPSQPATTLPWGRNRLTYVAGEGHFGAMDSILESLFKSMVDRMVPDAFDLTMTYAKATSIYCPPPSKLTDTVLHRINEGSLLFNYIGHGHATAFDNLHWSGHRFPILRVPDIQRANEQADIRIEKLGDADQPANIASRAASTPTSIAFLSCCSTGWFDLPNGGHSMAEAMLFAPRAGGALAVIAGSRVTHPYANTVLQLHMTKSLLLDRAPTVGLLDLQAEQAMIRGGTEGDRELDSIALPIAIAGKWKTSLPNLRRMHARLYNLLGDPAMSIAIPEEAIDDIAIVENHLTGRVRNISSGRVVIFAETQRAFFAHAEKLQPVNDGNDKDLETKAANNYALANNRVLAQFEGVIHDGRFDIILSAPLSSATALVRAYATGTNASGQFTDAIGALRLLPSTGADAQHTRP